MPIDTKHALKLLVCLFLALMTHPVTFPLLSSYSGTSAGMAVAVPSLTRWLASQRVRWGEWGPLIVLPYRVLRESNVGNFALKKGERKKKRLMKRKVRPLANPFMRA